LRFGSKVPTLFHTGVVFRCVSIEYWQTPLSPFGAWENGGRYNIGRNVNPAKAFGSLYTSYSLITALQEIGIFLNLPVGVPTAPSVLCSLQYSFNSVLDLTDMENKVALQTYFQ